jgi:hypothetical protein
VENAAPTQSKLCKLSDDPSCMCRLTDHLATLNAPPIRISIIVGAN